MTGPSKGKTQLGIYEFEGDLLKLQVSAPGAPRPTRFDAIPADGGVLTVWKR